MTKSLNVDDYINAQPSEIRERLLQIRKIFYKVLPNTQESIRYAIPAFTVGRHHLYISAYKNHIGMYPMYGLPELENEITSLRGKGTKGALHFKHSEKLPLELIEKIIVAKNNS